MPTSRNRQQITEISQSHAAPGVARAAWPQEASSTQPIDRLAMAGDHLEEDPQAAHATPRTKAKALAGRFPSPLGSNYLDELRREWSN